MMKYTLAIIAALTAGVDARTPKVLKQDWTLCDKVTNYCRYGSECVPTKLSDASSGSATNTETEWLNRCAVCPYDDRTNQTIASAVMTIANDPSYSN